MATASLPLSLIVDVEATVSAQTAAGPTYNTGCIIGPTRIVGASGVPARVTMYPSTSAMIAAGYSANSPEVLAAQTYFSKPTKSSPPPLVYIGLQDSTAIGTATLAAGGENYVVGDVISPAQAGAQGAQFTVTTVGANGAITALALKSQGTGYAVATGLPVTGGAGTGAEISITAVGESALQAVIACRAASQSFYGVSVCGAQKADILPIMQFCESATPDTAFFAVTADADALAAASTSILAEAAAGNFENSVLTASTTQGGAYPSNAYMDAAVMGMALGMFTGLAGSYFTLNNTSMSGVYYEPLTAAQASAVKTLGGNVYLSYANNQYKFFQHGQTPSGTFFDQTIFEKAFVSDLQYALVGVLAANLVVKQTDIDQEMFLAAATSVCEKYVQIGWIAPGVYEGSTITPRIGGVSISNGQSLPKGYSVQSPSYSTQLAADRDARKAMPVYVFLTLAGAVHSLSVGVSITL